MYIYELQLDIELQGTAHLKHFVAILENIAVTKAHQRSRLYYIEQ